MENKDEKSLVNQSIVLPAVTPEEAVEAWNKYLALKKQIATKDDIQYIQGKKFYKKSYWRKLATFFNLSVEVTHEESQGHNTETEMVFHFTCKATAPNGRYAFGTGSCNLREKGRLNTIHNTRSTAETRAFNRAVSNLVGGGEVSAEEVDSESTVQEGRKPPTKSVLAASSPSQAKCEICGAIGKYHKKDCPNRIDDIVEAANEIFREE